MISIFKVLLIIKGGNVSRESLETDYSNLVKDEI